MLINPKGKVCRTSPGDKGSMCSARNIKRNIPLVSAPGEKQNWEGPRSVTGPVRGQCDWRELGSHPKSEGKPVADLG